MSDPAPDIVPLCVSSESRIGNWRKAFIPCALGIALRLATPTIAGADTPSIPDLPYVVARLPDGTLKLSGHIDDAMARRFHELAAGKNARRVVVTSYGGDSLSAISIGEDIQRSGLSVVVEGACMSACADFVFLPARQRIVRPNSLVAFHHTSSSLLRMVPPSQLGALSPKLREEAQRGEALFKLGRIPPKFYLEPQLMLGTQCYALINVSSPNYFDIAYMSTYDAWVPDKSYFTNAGLAVEGYWPVTAADFAQAWNSVFPNKHGVAMLFGGPRQMVDTETQRRLLESVPRCDTSGGRLRLP